MMQRMKRIASKNAAVRKNNRKKLPKNYQKNPKKKKYKNLSDKVRHNKKHRNGMDFAI